MAVDLGLSLFTSAGILLFLALFTTILRCVARIYVVKAFGLDDWLMIVTVVRIFHLICLSPQVSQLTYLRFCTHIIAHGCSTDEALIKASLLSISQRRMFH
jgi:hypothetical protein